MILVGHCSKLLTVMNVKNKKAVDGCDMQVHNQGHFHVLQIQ